MTSVEPVGIDEQMVWTLARQARPGDVMVVGVATAMATAAALLARELLVPDLTLIAAATVSPRLHDLAQPMLAPETLNRLGVGTLGQSEILDQIQRGRVSLQFISPAQVDGAGRVNTSRIRRPDGSWLRLPGGLATADIAVLVGRLVAYRAEHSTRFLPPAVDFTTGAGHDQGSEWRKSYQLPGSGVQTIVTERAVLAWAGDGWGLIGLQPGWEVDTVVAQTGFPLRVDSPSPVLDEPPPEALDLLRRIIDPHGFRRMEVKATRRQALVDFERLAVLS